MANPVAPLHHQMLLDLWMDQSDGNLMQWNVTPCSTLLVLLMVVVECVQDV